MHCEVRVGFGRVGWGANFFFAAKYILSTYLRFAWVGGTTFHRQFVFAVLVFRQPVEEGNMLYWREREQTWQVDERGRIGDGFCGGLVVGEKDVEVRNE